MPVFPVKGFDELEFVCLGQFLDEGLHGLGTSLGDGVVEQEVWQDNGSPTLGTGRDQLLKREPGSSLFPQHFDSRECLFPLQQFSGNANFHNMYLYYYSKLLGLTSSWSITRCAVVGKASKLLLLWSCWLGLMGPATSIPGSSTSSRWMNTAEKAAVLSNRPRMSTLKWAVLSRRPKNRSTGLPLMVWPLLIVVVVVSPPLIQLPSRFSAPTE